MSFAGVSFDELTMRPRIQSVISGDLDRRITPGFNPGAGDDNRGNHPAARARPLTLPLSFAGVTRESSPSSAAIWIAGSPPGLTRGPAMTREGITRPLERGPSPPLSFAGLSFDELTMRPRIQSVISGFLDRGITPGFNPGAGDDKRGNHPTARVRAAPRRAMATPAGLEPATPSLEGWCSIH